MVKENNFIKAMKELTGANTAEEANGKSMQEAGYSKNRRNLKERKKAETQKNAFEITVNTDWNAGIQGEVTTISKTMVIVGDVKSSDNLQVLGLVRGPIETTKELVIKGKVLGDIRGKNVILKNCAVQGNVFAENHLIIDEGSILLGSIYAGDLIAAGKVKGNIVVKDLAKLGEVALVNGDITAERITMEQGAKLNGKVTILSQEKESIPLFEIKFDV
ncbi:MAG: polymer-forming cytoskeletal protein [Anaerovorax sp.]